MLTGYLHRDYAASFLEFGTPRLLPNSQGWILVRPIGDASSSRDAMGCYPLFCCRDWHALRADLATCHEELVSIVLVTDPLGDYSPDVLRGAFEHVVPFKDHFVVETGRPLAEFVSKSHRAHAMRALKDVSVEVCREPVTFIDDWQRLYGILA